MVWWRTDQGDQITRPADGNEAAERGRRGSERRMKKRRWNDLYVSHTTALFAVWLFCCAICLLFKFEIFVGFFIGTAFGWLGAVFTSRATNEVL